MVKPFRFGVQTSAAAGAPEWRARARRAEDLGYATLYVPDHFGDQWGPLVAMTVAAEATSTLNVGSLVLDNDYRHPVVLAKEVATLDLVSGGRVEFGLGAGWMTSDYDESGIPLDPPGERIDRMLEAVTIMKQLWREGSSTFEGRHYRTAGAQGFPRPHRPGGPKIVLAGGGRRVLSVAAREADIVGVNPNLGSGSVGPEVARSAVLGRYRERLDWIRRAAGDRFDDLELQILTFVVAVGTPRRQMAEQIAPVFGLSPDEAEDVPIGLAGSVDEICETLSRRREELGLSYVVVHEGEMGDFAPVVARLAGT